MPITRALHGYRAFGLAIHSELELPELVPDRAAQADVRIRLNPERQGPARRLARGTHRFGTNMQRLEWPGVGAFEIRGTEAIDITPDFGVSESLLNLPLLGPVIALQLHLRGMLVFHASGIEVDGRGVLFLGAKGVGKSTIAASFVASGHRLLSDDVMAIDFGESAGPQIKPGFPQLKLVDDAANKVILNHSVTKRPPIPDFPKQLRRLTDNFSHAIVPVDRVYVIGRGPIVANTPLVGEDALRALMCFSYVSLFRNRRLTRQEASLHLQQCTALANSVRISKLELPRDLDRIEEVIRVVEEDQS